MKEMLSPALPSRQIAGVPVVNGLMFLALFFLAAGIGSGIYAQVVGHHHAFANTREMPWGMLIGVYAYFAIISTGLCLLAALSHLFGGNRLAPLANRMVWLSIISILAAFLVIGLEIENPWRMALGVILHPNVTSNIWWMGTLYGMAVGIMLVEMYLILNRRFSAALIFGVAGAVAEALANSNLGSVFASLNARPFWYGPQLPIFFLACAFLSGAAAIVLFTHLSHVLTKKQLSPAVFFGMQAAGKVMALMIFLIAIATAWKFANAYSGNREMILAADSMVTGPLATHFWLFEIGIGMVLPFALLLVSRLNSVQAMSAAALMVLVGQFFSRFNMVVSGQVVSPYSGYSDIPLYLSYTPTASEWLLVVGGIGLVGYGFLVGERFFGSIFSADDTH
ncbi:MAG: polysulfide reductase NrfD [Desulfobulbaceae bacterium]|nr:MAG: polysulfide reductase NrfD [Desulfobulbaceae bacterium]